MSVGRYTWSIPLHRWHVQAGVCVPFSVYSDEFGAVGSTWRLRASCSVGLLGMFLELRDARHDFAFTAHYRFTAVR